MQEPEPDTPLLLEPRETYDRFIVGADLDGEFFVYDSDQIIKHLMETDETEEDEDKDEQEREEERYIRALDHFYYNIKGAHLGPGTPRYISKDYCCLFPSVDSEHYPKTEEKSR